MTLFPIAATDMDVIIGIIAVIGWILAQVLGRKKEGTPSERPPDSTTAPADPQEELRKFFEEMERSLKPPPPPEPEPARPPPLPASPPRRRRAPAPQPVAMAAAPVAEVLEPPVRAAAEAAQAFIHATTVATARAGVAPSLPPQSPLMLEGLHNPAALRTMIVAMEVLGKPVALRTPG